MNKFVEQLESRTLFSAVSISPDGPYTGVVTPTHGSKAIFLSAFTGKKIAAHVPAILTPSIADNSEVTGTLVLDSGTPDQITYSLSGTVIGATVSLSLDLNGSTVGTFAGKLKAQDKKLIGPLTGTLNGQGIAANLNLTNTTGKKSKGSNQNLALAPGYYPNETPPAVGSGISAGTSPGDQTGITGGNNSGIGVIGGDTGSLLG